MNVFKLRNYLVDQYRGFSTGYSTIYAADIQQYVQIEYNNQRYWPAPLVQINPHFKSGKTIDVLTTSGALHPLCEKIFCFENDDGIRVPLALHQHQEEAIAVAQRQESYILTTGTGSGKSLSYFIPIIDRILKVKETDKTSKTRAIIIYPMNALANSQKEELEKFLKIYPENNRPITYARYTGQEDEEERQRIAANPPDILLTNFMMLELLLIRQDEKDKAVIKNAEGLEFLVLDELHTYRGRQGADVALLIRRVRERLNLELLCIGTSATMATEGTQLERSKVVANVSSRLFGAIVKPENIITETLKRATDENKIISQITSQLKQAIQTIDSIKDYSDLYSNPLSIWVELTMGLEWRENKWVRAKPITIDKAAELLAKDSGEMLHTCINVLTSFLLKAYNIKKDGKAFFAFRLHQFISGANTLYATLEEPGSRYLTLDGQQFVPGHRDKRLFPTYFCRECGQEYHPVWNDVNVLEPRMIDDTVVNDERDLGFFMPDTEHIWSDDIERYPEGWIDYTRAEPSLKRDYRHYAPRPLGVAADGTLSPNGLSGWYIPGKFRLCLRCGIAHGAQGRDATRLSSLSSEGRSTATTVLSMTMLRYFYQEDTELPREAKKLLGFTDNRQDASLQAGHFNDFIHILLLRSALVRALAANNSILSQNELAQKVFEALGFDKDENKVEYVVEDKLKARGQLKTSVEESMRNMLGYRLYYDLRRGWRINNPNLEQLGILHIRYLDLEAAAQDQELWEEAPLFVRDALPQTRYKVLRTVLETMRQGLAIRTRYLDQQFLEQLKNDSFNNLIEPWSFGNEEDPATSKYFYFDQRPRNITRIELNAFITGGSRSALGKKLKQASMWDIEPESFERITDESYGEMMRALLYPLEQYGIIERVSSDYDIATYQLSSAVLQWHLVEEGKEEEILQTKAASHPFFRSLYRNVAQTLQGDTHQLFKFESREHTAQVDSKEREDREAKFRKAELPILFCSPTMELGVDISTLNTVYLRNVPPTPANYAQRSGRAGRSGQPALIVTYCAAQSPHDQYFFAEPVRMVHGEVKAPTLDLSNQDLIESHLHAIWVSELGEKLSNSIRGLLDLSNDAMPILEELRKRILDKALVLRTQQRGEKIIRMLSEELTTDKAPWFDASWLSKVSFDAPHAFDKAIDRWRDMFRATAQQMEKSNKILNDPTVSSRERKEAKSRYDEAYRQQNLLLQEKATLNSDFYTYRYFASQGFLPGYNFPRLPLMAYIPGRSGGGRSETYLTRSRFLALAEFGPFSLIYHEGSQYRVVKAMLSSARESQPGGDNILSTTFAKICHVCGYGHFQQQRDVELCMSCGAPLGGALEIHNLFRIDNVSTKRALRITADEEERMRQGYEMQTTVQYALEDGKLQYTNTQLISDNTTLLDVQYAPSATVWRMNLGWRRRRDRNIRGFFIDPISGHWSKNEDPDNEEPIDQDRIRAERIVPFVEDRRNILVIKPSKILEETVLVSLQYALKRGIEAHFQLEESELMAEPLPSRELRNAILFYEASEGGAGVLTRLAHDPHAFAVVAKKALEICHYEVSESCKPQTLTQTMQHDGSPLCEAGCYKCLLSYYNQPDHDLIDRQNPELIGLLCSIVNSTLKPKSNRASERIDGSASDETDKNIIRLLQKYELPMPNLWKQEISHHFIDALYIDTQIALVKHNDISHIEALESLGYFVVALGNEPAEYEAAIISHLELLKGASL